MLSALYKFYKKASHKFFSKDRHFAERLRGIIGFTPSNLYIFKVSFYHKSTLNNNLSDDKGLFQSNERLEYLGDALLSFVVGEFLFNKYPNADEGFLTKMRSKIVKRKMLNYISEQMGLDHLMMEFNHTAISQSMLGNALEALIGAIFIEKGFDYTRLFVLNKILKPFINIDQLELYDDNYKSQLLEWCQKNGQTVNYKLLARYKFEKRDRFKVAVMVDGQKIATADDFNKKSAEQMASEKAMVALGIMIPEEDDDFDDD